MTRHPAWLLDFGARQMAAVGLREVLHVAFEPQLARIPQSPPHCSRIVVVEGQILPAWDVAAWLGVGDPGRIDPLCAVVAYRAARSAQVELGALLLAGPPRRIEVGDEDSCELPAGSAARWRAISSACVGHGGRALPILDLAFMFSDALSMRRVRSSTDAETMVAA